MNLDRYRGGNIHNDLGALTIIKDGQWFIVKRYWDKYTLYFCRNLKTAKRWIKRNPEATRKIKIY